MTEWHHVVAQGATWADPELYVDGVKYAEVSSTNNGVQPATDLSLGAGEDGESSPGPGAKLAEVAIYDHVLAPERINAHYLSVKK